MSSEVIQVYYLAVHASRLSLQWSNLWIEVSNTGRNIVYRNHVGREDRYRYSMQVRTDNFVQLLVTYKGGA
jgi:hypothetical protein